MTFHQLKQNSQSVHIFILQQLKSNINNKFIINSTNPNSSSNKEHEKLHKSHISQIITLTHN